MMIISDLDERDMKALTEFVEKLRAAGSGKEAEPPQKPEYVLADGIDFGDGRRWDNPRGAPHRRG